MLPQMIATFCAALFAGAAVYINVVEHPARMALGPATALAQWAPSYQRATLMQAPLALIGATAGVVAWATGGHMVWLIGALLLGAVIPITLLVILPTNKRLQALPPAAADAGTRHTIKTWARLHLVRDAAGLLATAAYLWADH